MGVTMTKKVALVNPQLVSSGWSRGLRPEHMDDVLPRHSLTFLSSALKHAGHQVVLMDLRLMSGWDKFESALQSERPDFICVTAHTSERDAALECLSRSKSILPDGITLAGGIHFTMFPQDALDTGNVDFVVLGEGEISLPKLVHTPDIFPQVFWGETPDLDQIPFEDRALYGDYRNRILFPLWDLPVPIVDVLTKRGCPWKCRFCCGPGEQNLYTRPSRRNPSLRTPSLRHRSVSNVIAELQALYSNYQFKSIIFHDDQFLIQKNWVIDFCQALQDAGFVERGIRWWAASRADVVCQYPEVIEMMRDAGLQILSIGFESFSDRMLQWMMKETSREQNLQAAAICHSLGIDLFANVIFGMPFSDGRWYLEDDLCSLEAIREIRPRYFSPACFSPIPGSWFHQWAVDQKLIAEQDPRRQGSRTPGEVKVTGVDYATLNRLIEDLQQSLGYTCRNQNSVLFRMRRFLHKPLSEKWQTIKRLTIPQNLH